EQQYIQMDTTHILFICGGSFVGMDEIIRRRLGKRRIGFAGEDPAGKNQDLILRNLQPEDLVEFGLIPELVGRLPIACPLDPIDADGMVRILTEPRNAIVRQYEHLFSLEGATLEFTRDALRLLAERAIRRQTGARALRAVMDEAMLDRMYELPELDNANTTYVIDAAAIEAGTPLPKLARRIAKESA
ncbi:MAG: AAA family ATPase, partial [Phycisphaerales bacterium]